MDLLTQLVFLVLALGDDGPPAPSGVPEKLVVSLKVRVEVHHTPVLLEDVADLAGPPTEVTRVKKLEVCPAPTAGKPRIVTPAGVRLAGRLAGIDLPADRLVGASQTEVVANWSELLADRLFESAQSFVLAQTAQLGDRVLLERLGRPEAIALLDGAGDAELRSAFVGSPRSGGMIQVKVSAFQGDTLVGERIVLFKVRRFGRQIRLVTDVDRGAMVADPQVLALEGEWNTQQGTPVVSVKEIAGMVAVRELKAGQILMKEAFEQPLLVDRGGSVRMVLRTGGLEIVALGVAQKAGRRGEVIPVMNPATQKLVQAELIERGASGDVVARVR